MASQLFSSIASQLFANESQETAAATVPLPPQALAYELSKWSSTASSLFVEISTKLPSPLLPPHRTMPNTVFILLILFCVAALYLIPISPYPRTTRGKQIAAFPFLFNLAFQPLFFNCSITCFHLAIAVNSIAIATRMFDIYYIQPWTGFPGKLCRTSHSEKPAVPMDPVERAKKDLDLDSDDSTSNCPATADVQASNQFLMWSVERLKLEMWAPLRKVSNRPKVATDASTQMSWRGLTIRFILYSILADIDIFLLSFYSNADLQGMTVPQTIIFIHAFAIFIMVHMFGICFSVAIIYSIKTGEMITTSEWNMIENKLPCFALTPAEFWVTWHTLFRFLWIDLGYLPSKRFCERQFGPDRVGYRMAKLVKETLPVLAVFSLSAVLHSYLVQAMWREPIWGQVLYFFIQAVAVMLTKAVERSSFGRMVLKTYSNSGPMVQMAMRGMAMLMMAAFHLATVPMFIEPYKRNNMWLTVKQRSVLWWMFGK